MKLTWQYNKYEQGWSFSEDDGLNLWIISKSYDIETGKFKGYEVTFNHCQATFRPGHSYQSFTYGNPTPIFYCRYLKEAKAFVQLCINSKTMPTKAYEYKNFPGHYGVTVQLPVG